MWNRIKVQKHATFADAHAQREQWLNDNPSTDAGMLNFVDAPRYKVRIKARNSDSFDFVVWERNEKGASKNGR